MPSNGPDPAFAPLLPEGKDSTEAESARPDRRATVGGAVAIPGAAGGDVATAVQLTPGGATGAEAQSWPEMTLLAMECLVPLINPELRCP